MAWKFEETRALETQGYGGCAGVALLCLAPFLIGALSSGSLEDVRKDSVPYLVLVLMTAFSLMLALYKRERALDSEALTLTERTLLGPWCVKQAKSTTLVEPEELVLIKETPYPRHHRMYTEKAHINLACESGVVHLVSDTTFDDGEKQAELFRKLLGLTVRTVKREARNT